MSGMLGIGQSTKNQAVAGFTEVARGETQRNSMNDKIDQMEEAGKKQTMMAAGGMALSVGMAGSSAAAGTALAAAGPAGWAIGAGLILASLF